MSTPELPTPEEIGKLFANNGAIDTDALFSAMLKMQRRRGGQYFVCIEGPPYTESQKSTVEQMLQDRGWKVDRYITVDPRNGASMHISAETSPGTKSHQLRPPTTAPKKQRPYTVSGRAAACANARHEAGWTIREVCELAGVSKHAYWGMETGETRNPRTETRISVAKALDIDPELFLGRRK